MWEILVPTEMMRNGEIKKIKTRYHKVWDAKIRNISGGATVLSPAKGQWLSPNGKLFEERMIPVRIIIRNPEEIKQIIELTIKYYNQEAVLAYRVSDEVLLVHRNEKDK